MFVVRLQDLQCTAEKFVCFYNDFGVIIILDNIEPCEEME